jgi:hypothetical protein
MQKPALGLHVDVVKSVKQALSAVHDELVVWIEQSVTFVHLVVVNPQPSCLLHSVAPLSTVHAVALPLQPAGAGPSGPAGAASRLLLLHV